MKLTNIIVELEYDDPNFVMKIRKDIQNLLDSDEKTKSYSIYQKE